MILVVHGVAMDPEQGLGKLNQVIVEKIIELWQTKRFDQISLTNDKNDSPAGESFGTLAKKELVQKNILENLIIIPDRTTFETVGEIQVVRELIPVEEFEVLTLWSHRKRTKKLYAKLIRDAVKTKFHRTKIIWPGLRRLFDDFIAGILVAYLLPAENFLVKKIRVLRAKEQGIPYKLDHIV